MHEERDTLLHFVMSFVKYRESHYVTVLDMYGYLSYQPHFIRHKVFKEMAGGSLLPC